MLIVRRGQWLYDGSVQKPVDIVAFDFDWWFELARAEGSVEEDEEARPLGPDGSLYYVRFGHAGETETPTWVESGGHPSVDEAMAYASEKVPSPIEWHA